MPLPTELIITVSPGLELAAREEHVPRRSRTRSGAPRRPRPRARPGRDQVRRPAGELLRVAAGGREADEPGREAERLAAGAAVAAVAAGVHQVRHRRGRRPASPRRPRRLPDAADDLDAEDERRLDREARDALADVDVEVVQRAGADVDRHLAGPGLGSATPRPAGRRGRRTRGTRPPSRDLPCAGRRECVMSDVRSRVKPEPHRATLRRRPTSWTPPPHARRDHPPAPTRSLRSPPAGLPAEYVRPSHD